MTKVLKHTTFMDEQNNFLFLQYYTTNGVDKYWRYGFYDFDGAHFISEKLVSKPKKQTLANIFGYKIVKDVTVNNN